MTAYVIRRVLAVFPVMAVVVLFVFVLLRLSPGDPAAIIAGDYATPQAIEKIRVSLGLDQPVHVQLSLYAVGAREAWQVEAERQSYHYVLDDEKVPVPTAEIDRDWISETVFEVADGILGQGFEPTPSYAACTLCDYRIACPAAER